MAADPSKPCILDSAWLESSTNTFKSQCVTNNTKTGPQLTIVTRKQLRRFLQVIQPEFLRVVNPRESGMLDILMAADLLTDTDNESMSGKDVNCRKDQARKLWMLLNKMTVANFMSQVAPELLRQFFHIVPEEFILKEGEQMPTEIDEHEECLRHDIVSSVREETLADMLYHHGCLSFEDYEDVVSGDFDKDVVWNKLLDSFRGHPDDVKVPLLSGLREVLEKYSLRVPDDLSKLLSRGLPCTCGKEPASLPVATPLPIRKYGFGYVRMNSNTITDVQNWMTENNLQLNSNKTEAILIWTTSKLSKATSGSLELSNSSVSMSSTVNNLGVALDNTPP